MGIDPRGPRFSALITTAVLAVVLITGSAWLLAAQALVFAAGSFLGLRYSPYGLLYRQLVRPRLGPPSELEPEAPPRFAQAVGLVFAVVGVAGSGVPVDSRQVPYPPGSPCSSVAVKANCGPPAVPAPRGGSRPSGGPGFRRFSRCWPWLLGSVRAHP